MGIYVRDYKTYDLGIGQLGASVSTVSIVKLLEHFGEEQVFENAERMIQRYQTSMFAIVQDEKDPSVPSGWSQGVLLYQPLSESSLSGHFDELVEVLQYNEGNLPLRNRTMG